MNCYKNISDEKISFDSMIYYNHKDDDENYLQKIIQNRKMKYTQYYSLTDNVWKYVPVGWHLYFHGSNGLASGNTIEEAILQGIYEVVEEAQHSKVFR